MADDTPSSSSVQISSAPEIHEYEPPEPTPNDPYPGYYQMPDEKWAAYEPTYYKTFWDQWQQAAQQSEGALSSGAVAKGFEGLDEDNLESFNALDEAARSRKNIEDTKNITKNIKSGPSAPKMNIAQAKQGSLANQRHQLSTLLHSAYQDRDAIEEKIAIARRNRKEAGSRYGEPSVHPANFLEAYANSLQASRLYLHICFVCVLPHVSIHVVCALSVL